MRRDILLHFMTVNTKVIISSQENQQLEHNGTERLIKRGFLLSGKEIV